jgi:hypothetical protein
MNKTILFSSKVCAIAMLMSGMTFAMEKPVTTEVKQQTSTTASSTVTVTDKVVDAAKTVATPAEVINANNGAKSTLLPIEPKVVIPALTPTEVLGTLSTTSINKLTDAQLKDFGSVKDLPAEVVSNINREIANRAAAAKTPELLPIEPKAPVANQPCADKNCPKDAPKLDVAKDAPKKDVPAATTGLWDTMKDKKAQLVTYLADLKTRGWSKWTTNEKVAIVAGTAAVVAVTAYVAYKIYKSYTAEENTQKSVFRKGARA